MPDETQGGALDITSGASGYVPEGVTNTPPGDGNPHNPYNGGGRGGGGGGGGGGPSAEQQQAAANLGSITGYNADTLRDQYEDTLATFDLADQQNENLKDNNILLARQNAGSDWFRQHLKLQRTASSLNDRAGNATRGSYLYDYRDLLTTADDNIDSETLDTLRQNENQVLQSYFEALAQNNVNRQEAAMNTENGLRELYADYVAQLNNIHPDLASQYMNNGGHTLNGSPDWLDTDFFDEHRLDPLSPERQGLYRPDRANHDARDKGLKESGYNTASSAATSYWERMNRGYDQRERQA